MTDPVHDPVHRARHAFEPDGDNIVVETWIEPGGGLPAHYHPAQEERWSVLEGRIRIQLGDSKRVIGPEDGELVVTAGTKHGFASVEETDAHLRCYATPALGLEDFLTESAAAAREGLFLRGGIPRSWRGARWAADFLKRYQDDVVLTFPPRFVQRALIGLLAR